MSTVGSTLQTSCGFPSTEAPRLSSLPSLALTCLFALVTGCNSWIQAEISIPGTLTLTSDRILPGFRNGSAELRLSPDQTTVTLIQGTHQASYTKGVDSTTGALVHWEITEGEVQTTQTTNSRSCRLSSLGCQSPSTDPSSLVPPETCLGTQWITQEQDWVEVNARVTWTLPGDHAEFTGSSQVRIAERVISLTPCQSLGGP